MHNTSTDETASRRDFLRTGSMVAAFTAVAAAGRATAAPPGGDAAGEGRVDVRQFGAVGDGQTDDAAAFRAALEHAVRYRIRDVHVPAGVFMIGRTLQLPTGTHLVGEGRSLTTLKAPADTRFDKFKPHPNTLDLRQRCSMITTAGVGSVRQNLATDIAIKAMTIDWNHCPTDGFGHSVLLIDSCDRAVLEDLNLINCLPKDHPTDPEEEKRIGHRFRCECIMFSNSNDGLMDRCRLTDSGYRPLSLAYGSQRTRFVNGVIHAENPIRRHVFCETHGDALPRDRRAAYAPSQIMFLNSTFILDGGRGGFDGISCHGGSAHVENCDFYISKKAMSHFRIIFKPFSGATNCCYINNRFHLDEEYAGQFSILGTDSGAGAESITFAGNRIKASYGSDIQQAWRCLVRIASNNRRVIVRDNLFDLEWRGDGPPPPAVIQLSKCDAFVVANNIIETRSADGSKVAKTGILLQNVGGGQVLGNYTPGITIEGDAAGVVIQANSVAKADILKDTPSPRDDNAAS